LKRLCSLTVLVLSFAVAAWARAQGAATPAASSAPSTKQQKHHPKKKIAGEPNTTPPPESEQPKPLPPPAQPHAADQKPAPYLKTPPPAQPVRKVEVGPDFGVWQRPADGSDASYGPGFSWGVHARIEIASWIAVRTSFVHNDLPVTVRSGSLGLTGADIHQPDLEVTLLGARLEPTWVVTPRFRAWLGLGIAWGRVVGPPLTTSGAFGTLNASERDGVLLESSGALGLTVDVIPNWLSASLAGSAGFLTNQSGSLFDGQQDRDEAGQYVFVGGLPKFSASYSALFSVGLLL
jgi:hypothetical protein